MSAAIRLADYVYPREGIGDRLNAVERNTPMLTALDCLFHQPACFGKPPKRVLLSPVGVRTCPGDCLARRDADAVLNLSDFFVRQFRGEVFRNGR